MTARPFYRATWFKISAVLLVLASVQVAVGFLGPGRATEAELGARLLLVPFVAILVATTVDDLSERQPFSRALARSLRTD